MTRFRAVPPEERLIRQLGLVTLVYHRRSGITHILAEPAPQILAALDEAGPLDAARLTAHLGRSYELSAEDGDDPTATVAARLDELAGLGLVIAAGPA